MLKFFEIKRKIIGAIFCRSENGFITIVDFRVEISSITNINYKIINPMPIEEIQKLRQENYILKAGSRLILQQNLKSFASIRKRGPQFRMPGKGWRDLEQNFSKNLCNQFRNLSKNWLPPPKTPKGSFRKWGFFKAAFFFQEGFSPLFFFFPPFKGKKKTPPFFFKKLEKPPPQKKNFLWGLFFGGGGVFF